MKFLNAWKEFGASNRPSMKESFEKVPYEGISQIAAYLDRGKVKVASAGVSVDFFTKETISDKKEILTDGEYSWSNSLSHYVMKYNLRLPKEFEDKVLMKTA